MTRKTFLASLAVGLVLASASGLRAEFISGSGGLNNLGSFSGTVSYSFTDSSSATLEFSLTNTSPAANGGFLTAFAFNNPSNLITGVTLTSLDNTNFGLLGGSGFQDGVNGSPFGQFDIGASTGSNWEGGGNPSLGLGVGASATFTFHLTGSGLDGLTVTSFFNTLSVGPGDGEGPQPFVARFRGFSDEGSDKVPGHIDNEDEVTTQKDSPEPASMVLCGVGLGGLLGGAYLKKRKRS
jgi:hypothetical protein